MHSWRILRKLCFCWRMLINNVWMLVRSLLLATWCLVKLESNLVSPVDAHQASPALYQRSGCMKDTLGYTPKGGDEMRWNKNMLCYVTLSCCHVMSPFLWNTKWRWTSATWPCSLTLENAWHDMINGKPVLGLAGSLTESRNRFMHPWTLPPHLP